MFTKTLPSQYQKVRREKARNQKKSIFSDKEEEEKIMLSDCNAESQTDKWTQWRYWNSVWNNGIPILALDFLPVVTLL
jgi:hypothetical protein